MPDGLVAALARAQAAFPPIVKSHENKHFQSQFADVADVLAAVRPVLAAEGIVVTQATRIGDEGGVTLVTSLLLEGDPTEEIDSQFPLYVAGLTAQQVGSLLTYHRRYQLCAILGVHPVGDDDDGNLAATAQTAPRYGADTGKVGSERVKGDPYELAAANPPEKPLAAMTAGEMARYGDSIGVRVSGSKADILRTLEPYVKAASGDEPWPVEGEGGTDGGSGRGGMTPTRPLPEPESKPFAPVVARSAETDSGTARKAVNSAMKAQT